MHEWYAPSVGPELAPYVHRVHGYRMGGFAPGTHIGMPSPHLTLIVTFGEPVVVSRPGEELSSYDALAAGLHARPVGIHHEGTQHGIQVDITPAGARGLLGCPAGELTGGLVDLCDLLLAPDRALSEAVSEQGSWAGRVDVVLRALTRRLADGRSPRSPRPEVAHAWDEIRRTHGTVPVWAVASSVGWSGRHLGEQFRAEYGIGPKAASRLARFDRSRELVRRQAPLADIAVSCGYADQAHLTREWRELAGTTPHRWPSEDVLANAGQPPASR